MQNLLQPLRAHEMDPMRWTFWCSPHQADQLAEGLCALNFVRFSRTSLPVKAWVSTPEGGGEFVEIYTGTEAPELPLSIAELIQSLQIRVACVTCDETEGQEDWRQYFMPQHIPGICDILPPWAWSPLPSFSRKPERQGGSQVVVIEPQMAFGVGSHPTTQLGLHVLAWLQIQDPPNDWTTMLDAGTGSGICSIYARQIGVPFIVACDLDPDVFENLEKNFRHNQVSLPIRVRGDIRQVYGTFDWAFVNISAEIIFTELAHLCTWIAPKGYLFLTGFLSEDQSAISQMIQKKFAFLQAVWTMTQAQWSAVLLRKV